MANALFDSYRENSLQSTAVALNTLNIVLVFVDHGVDVPSPTADDFLDDIATGARIDTSGNFASKTFTDGTFDADDVTVATVSGAQFESVVIYENSGVESTSDLIVFIDTATGLPLTPNGGSVTVQWDSGTDRIFTI